MLVLCSQTPPLFDIWIVPSKCQKGEESGYASLGQCWIIVAQ